MSNQYGINFEKLPNGKVVPAVSCLCKELDLPPEQFAVKAMLYKRNPRIILKCDTEKNRVLLLDRDGTAKDRYMMDKIMEGTLKIDGFNIKELIDDNKDFFENLKQQES
jgi:hypothetical protein